MMDYESIISAKGAPKLSMRFNDILLEEAVPGYITNDVTGRDSLSSNIAENTIERYDGSRYKHRTNQSRDISVKYTLVSNNETNHRAALNKLRGILYSPESEQVQIIFGDEPDMFWRGTVSGFTQEQFVGGYSSSGEITIHCADPCKYTVEEFYIDLDRDTNEAIIDYDGTYKSYPRLQAWMYEEDGDADLSRLGLGDCGFIAWIDDKGHIIQLGNPDEINMDAQNKSETLVNQKFTVWDAAVQANWVQNAGINTNPSEHKIGNGATVGLRVYGGPVLGPTSFGQTGAFWHGPSASRVFEEADDWRINWTQLMAACYSNFRQISEVKQYYAVNNDKNTAPNSWDIYPHQTSSSNRYLWNYMEIRYSNVQTTITTTPTVISTHDGRTIDSIEELFCLNNSKSAPLESSFASWDENMSPNKEAKFLWNFKRIKYNKQNDDDKRDEEKSTEKKIIDQFDTNAKNTDAQQKGVIQVVLSHDSDFICGLSVWKGEVGTKATMSMYVSGATRIDVPIYIDEFNNFFGWTKYENGKVKNVPKRTCKINKKGNTFVFDICGIKRTVTSPKAGAKKANRITIWFGQYNKVEPLYMMGIKDIKFVRDHYKTNKNIPNVFSVNDSVSANCETGEILLNGLSDPSLGAIGNDWEEFCLLPGTNQIAARYSDWLEGQYVPDFRIYYRKAYI